MTNLMQTVTLDCKDDLICNNRALLVCTSIRCSMLIRMDRFCCSTGSRITAIERPITVAKDELLPHKTGTVLL